jgi:hypothetical protein
MFLYPMNEDATCVHCATALETGTTGTPMTFGAVLHRFEASDAEVTLGAISHHVESPPSYLVQPRL